MLDQALMLWQIRPKEVNMIKAIVRLYIDFNNFYLLGGYESEDAYQNAELVFMDIQ